MPGGGGRPPPPPPAPPAPPVINHQVNYCSSGAPYCCTASSENGSGVGTTCVLSTTQCNSVSICCNNAANSGSSAVSISSHHKSYPIARNLEPHPPTILRSAVQPQASTIPFPHPPLPLSQQRQLLQLQQLTLLPKHLVPVLHLDQLSPAARHLHLNGYFFYHCLPSSFDLKKLTTVLSASLKSCSSNEIAIYGGKAAFGLWLLLM